MSQQLRLLIYAGVAARQAGNPGTALLLLNRYLDIHEAQEDGSHGSQGGYNDFGLFTGIPRSSALPKAQYVPKAEREQVRFYVQTIGLGIRGSCLRFRAQKLLDRPAACVQCGASVSGFSHTVACSAPASQCLESHGI